MSAVSGVSAAPLVRVSAMQVELDLDTIRGAEGDIKKIRCLLKGDLKACYKLFKEAVEAGDAVAQIQLSHALFGMKWGEDHTKNFSLLTADDLEEFSYYPREFALFGGAYTEAMGLEGMDADWREEDARVVRTFRLAADRGYLPAMLELTVDKTWRLGQDSYGVAVQLRPYVGQGDKWIDYYFGRALKNGCQVGSPLYYEGMYWMNRSVGIQVKYPKSHQSFKEFVSYYISYEDCFNTYFDYDGFRHVGSSVVLAPSREAWEVFVKSKLGEVAIASPESYHIEYSPHQIRSLLSQYKVTTVHHSSFVESPDQGRDVEDWTGKIVHGFRIDSLSIYKDHQEVGTISVQEDTFKIHETIDDPQIEPVVKLIEQVMRRTGSAHSASAWLRVLESTGFASRL